MGIERVLKEKFGDDIKDIRQVYDEHIAETTAEVRSCDASIMCGTLALECMHKL